MVPYNIPRRSLTFARGRRIDMCRVAALLYLHVHCQKRRSSKRQNNMRSYFCLELYICVCNSRKRTTVDGYCMYHMTTLMWNLYLPFKMAYMLTVGASGWEFSITSIPLTQCATIDSRGLCRTDAIVRYA